MADEGRHLDYMRITSFPFGREVQQYLDRHDQVFVVEQNRDGQLRTLMLNELDVDKKKLIPVLHFDGMPLTSRMVFEGVMSTLAEEVAA